MPDRLVKVSTKVREFDADLKVAFCRWADNFQVCIKFCDLRCISDWLVHTVVE